MTTGQKLRAIRANLSTADHRVTQKEMAEWLGTSSQTYGQYENDKRTPPLVWAALIEIAYLALWTGIPKKVFWGKK